MGKYRLPSMGSEKDLLLVGITVPKLGGSFLDVLGWLPFLKEQKDGIIFLSPPHLSLSSGHFSCLLAKASVSFPL